MERPWDRACQLDLRDVKEAASSWESEGPDPVGLQAPPNEGVSYSEMRSHWKILKRDETRCDHRVVPVKGQEVVGIL